MDSNPSRCGTRQTHLRHPGPRVCASMECGNTILKLSESEPIRSLTVAKKKSRPTLHRTPQRKHKQTSKARKATPVRKSAKPRVHSKPVHRKKTEETTFVYDCTRPGCGYRIWREDKDEPGHLRFDLKCPKCHHKVFRCLGKGDVPESFEIPPQATPLDFDTMKTADLGSN